MLFLINMEISASVNSRSLSHLTAAALSMVDTHSCWYPLLHISPTLKLDYYIQTNIMT